MHTQLALRIQRGEQTILYNYRCYTSNMYERTIQYLLLHLIVGITMYIFYYRHQYTNLTVTDHFGSTIKSMKVTCMIAYKRLLPRTHAQGHDII